MDLDTGGDKHAWGRPSGGIQRGEGPQGASYVSLYLHGVIRNTPVMMTVPNGKSFSRNFPTSVVNGPQHDIETHSVCVPSSLSKHRDGDGWLSLWETDEWVGN